MLVMLESVVLEHRIVFQELPHTMQVAAVDLIQKQVEQVAAVPVVPMVQQINKEMPDFLELVVVAVVHMLIPQVDGVAKVVEVFV